jgi:dipeptidyl aminopeptidase/acylaminoacyl peptidase
VIDRLQFLWDEIGLLKDLYSHIFIFNIQTKTMKQITSGPYDDGGPVYSSFSGTPQWSPDGKWILFASDRSNDPDKNRNMDIFVLSAEGGEPRKLTTNPGIDGGPRWSPDGKWIVYATNIKPELIWYETLKLAVIPVTGGTPKILTGTLDRNCMQPRFSVDGKRIYFLLEDHGTQRLASISPDGNDLKRDLTIEKVVEDYDVAASGKIAFLATRPQLPDEVFSWAEGKTLQLTNTNASLLNQIQLGNVDRAEFKSKDGTPVEAFVVKPPNFDRSKKYPLLLWIHGGPTSQYAEQFEFTPQLLAANGYVVLLVNPRGSTGYGEDFCKAIFADWGDKDYDDVMAGVDYVLGQGYIDSDRMGVAGWSYGGMLTDHVITKTNRFKAAAAGASELNYLVDYGVDHYQYEWEKELGLPWENPEAYIKISPFFKIKNVKTPTLIMCGQEDVNVPFVNSEQFYQALKRLGVDTMFVVYPGQPHSFFKPSYQRDRLERWLAWFGHYLQGQPNKVPPPEPQTQQTTAK